MTRPAAPSGVDLAEVQAALLAWYAREGRNLPWRQTRDHYAILVSEVMLQQTQVERVIPKYHEFLERFPTLGALAAASRAEVIRAWSPLGYNLRAVRLHEIARQAVDRFGGELPREPHALASLKGLGPYTAAAVACFAFGAPVAVADTNVRRVLGRVLLGEPDGGQVSARQAQALAEQALPRDRAYEWNQALMDLGATICLARRPACQTCPLAGLCLARPSVERWRASLARERRARYRTGGSFVGSSRYYRGRLVETLRAAPDGQGLDLWSLGRAVKPDFGEAELPWLAEMIRRLERDGLVRVAVGGATRRGGDPAMERGGDAGTRRRGDAARAPRDDAHGATPTGQPEPRDEEVAASTALGTWRVMLAGAAAAG